MIKLFQGQDGFKYLLIVEEKKRQWRRYQDYRFRDITGEPSTPLTLLV